MSDATLWKKAQTWAQNNRLIVGFLSISAILILLANTTKAVDTLVDAFGRWTASGYADLQDCLNDTNANLRRVSECYRDFP